MSFEKALHFVLLREGGYANHPKDRGGATNKGVTQATYDSWRASRNALARDVREIEDVEVAAIYRTRYWQPAGCDKLPEKLAIVHFDAAVNHGVKRAIKLLQSICGAGQDGMLGEETWRAIAEILKRKTLDHLVSNYLSERSDFFDLIVKSDPGQSVFLRGWKNRIAALREDAGVA